MGFLLLLSVLINGVLVYGCFNLLKKNERVEDFFEVFREQLSGTLTAMKEIDSKEIFQKDDEVGIIFSELNRTLQQLDEFLGTEPESISQNDESKN